MLGLCACRLRRFEAGFVVGVFRCQRRRRQGRWVCMRCPGYAFGAVRLFQSNTWVGLLCAFVGLADCERGGRKGRSTSRLRVSSFC